MRTLNKFAVLSKDVRKFKFDGFKFKSEYVDIPVIEIKYWLDDIPVTKELYAFGTAVKKAMPWVRFGVIEDGYLWCSTILNSNAFNIFAEVVVYDPAQRYVYGRIGHKDYGITETCVGYGVLSRNITNLKIRADSQRKHMGISSDLNRAVKSAAKYFVPFSITEIANISYDEFRDKVVGAIQEVVNDADKFVRRCADFKVLTAELTNLIKQNATFVTPEFKEAAAQFIAAQSEAQVTRTRNVGAYHITLTTTNDVQYAHIATMANDVKSSRYAVLADNNGTTLKVEDIPYDIQSKLAVLMSVDDGSYMPEIGYKEDAESFWVERTEALNA